MATKQQQIDEFKKKKESYDNASTAEEKKAIINGVDKATTNKMNSTFSASNEQQTAQNKANSGLGRVETLTSTDSIISNDVKAKLNSTFSVPPAVTEADTYIKSQLQKIQSGKTSYSDQVKGMMDQIMNRDKFSYDVDNDPLFQQALASAMSSGKQAMQDTIGQASALTGGYGSTYATTAGNQAYNSFIEDAYDNLPQYYEMAMQAYQMEGDELYRQLGMFNDADDKEYSRNVTAYDATYQHRNRMYDEAYQIFRDSKTDAYNMANLQLSEHGQLVSDAVNYYNVTSDYANTLYNREYQKWNDEVNQAMQYAQMLNNDYWKQTNYDRGVFESDRAYNRDIFESDRDYNRGVFESDRAYNEGVRQYEQNYAQSEKWNQKDIDYKYSSLAENKRQFNVGMGDTNNDGVVSDEEYAKYVERYGTKEDANKSIEDNIPSGIKSKASKFETNGELEEYLDKQVAHENLTEEQADYLYSIYMIPEQVALNERSWTMVDNGGNNHFGGIDGNGVVRDQYGTEYQLDDLYAELKKTMSADDAKSYIKKLQKDLGITKK